MKFRSGLVVMSLVLWLFLAPIASVKCDWNDDDDDDDVKLPSLQFEKMSTGKPCKSNEDCYKIIGLSTYCCKNAGCCDWFSFLVFYHQQKTKEIAYKGPSMLYIAIISIVCLLVLIFICCICCILCLCKQCGCCKKKQQARYASRPIYTQMNSGRTYYQQQPAYMPIAQQAAPSVRPVNSVFNNNFQPPSMSPPQVPTRVQPSAPVEESLLNEFDTGHDASAPLAEFENFDKPPAYDDVIRTTVVDVSVVNETVTGQRRN